MAQKHFIFLILTLLLVLLVSCSSSDISEETKSSIDILYAHTIQMQDLSTNAQLTAIGLDASYLDEVTAQEHYSEKLQQLKHSFSDDFPHGLTIEEEIALLEEMMDEMMKEWALSS